MTFCQGGTGQNHGGARHHRQTIRRLEEKGIQRIDMVYVCPNAAIANQNLDRLNVCGNRHFAMATRPTLLPVHLKGLEANRINFVGFTPGTTFDLKGRGETGGRLRGVSSGETADCSDAPTQPGAQPVHG